MASEQEQTVAPIASQGTVLGDDGKDSNSCGEAGSTPLVAQPLQNDSAVTANPHIPSISASAVLGESSSLPEGTPVCKGHDFAKDGNTIDAIAKSMLTTGFQATNVGLAIQQIQAMRRWRLSDTDWKQGDDEALKPPQVRSRIRARIFLAYTSNQISSGQREVLKFLVQNKMVDCIVVSVIEHATVLSEHIFSNSMHTENRRQQEGLKRTL